MDLGSILDAVTRMVGAQDVVLMAAALGGFVVLAIGFVLFTGDDAASRKRIAQIDNGSRRKGRGGGSKRREASVKVAERLRELEQERKKRDAVTLRLRLEQAGLDMSPAQFMLVTQGAGCIAGAATYVLLGQPPLIALGVACIAAFGLPRMILAKMIERRRIKFTEHFASAIDILVRGVRSGLPISEGLRVIANEIEEPVKTEFTLLVDSVAVGMTLEEALERLARRVPSQDVDFFRTVLAIQKQTGGNLAESLSNLSEVLRDRKKLKGKIKALSSEARMSAIIIGSLPFLVCLAMYMLRPEYITVLFVDPFGQQMLIGGMIWMSFGIMIMRSMIKFDM